MICPFSVIVLVVVINFPHFHLLTQNNWASLTKLGPNHHWVKRTRCFFQMKGPCPLKICWYFSKFFSDTIWPEKLKYVWKHNIYCERNFQSLLPCNTAKVKKKSIFGALPLMTESLSVQTNHVKHIYLHICT